jgi:CO/xanthine dehydrogenase FAD-binding subunit
MSVVVANSLDEVLDALSARPDATLLAGGTDVMVEINLGHRRPTSIVSIDRVPELRTWTFHAADQTVQLGAAVRYGEIAAEPLAGWLPALAQAARTVGSPQIRAAATIGGNLGTCSPAGDGLPVLAALDAVVHLRDAAGRRDLPFADFMTGPKRTALAPGELIESVTVPVARGWQGFAKVGVRNAMVIATANACLAVDDLGERVSLALGAVGPVILRCPEAERIAGQQCDFVSRSVAPPAVAAFGEAAMEAARPIDDHRSTAQYRRHAVRVMAERLLRRAFPHG